ncbi:MAG TPA: hypothetical protein VFC23_11080 [Thermoanaerobaculia bacterium]|nr:hypothetical protein [Thermoanaerobaculia bacterium]
MTRLTAALLVCLALVSASAWALPVNRPAPVPRQEVSLLDALREWVESFLERHGLSDTRPDSETCRFQQEGSQADPNGSPH